MRETPELERSTCMECDKTPYILWKSAQWGTILLCGVCAQIVATQLMKDVQLGAGSPRGGESWGHTHTAVSHVPPHPDRRR
jgi:hypothetical protein